MAITLTSLQGGSYTLTAETGCTITGTFNVTNWSGNVSREATEPATVTLAIVSDGEVSINAWDETGTQGHVTGNGGGVTLPSGINMEVRGWSVSLDIDQASYGTFSSGWKYNKAKTAQMTGTVTGVLLYDGANSQPLPDA